jgi:hypothetical protein
MKKFLMAVAALALIGSVAFAGPNAGGVLFVHNATLAAPSNPLPPGYVACDGGTVPATCDAANTQLNITDNTLWVWRVYAAFKPCSAPRLKAISFGITYPDYNTGGDLILAGHGACIGDTGNGAQEYPSAGWPGSGGGNVLVYQYAQTTTITEAYWFAGYTYPYNGVAQFAVNANPDPDLGGTFGDDSLPTILDPIAAYGSLGFNEPGTITCPSEAAEGACCVGQVCTMTCEGDCQGNWLPNATCQPDNPCVTVATGACCIGTSCFILTQADCLAQGGRYIGDNQPCLDQTCQPVPTKTSTWGQIKAQYR